MPTYEYECLECGHRFEAFQNMSDEPLTECEDCKGPIKRLISGGSGIIFKGSGFYVTDNKGKASTSANTVPLDKSEKADKTEKTAAKSDSGKSSKNESENKSSSKKETAAAK